MSGTAATFGNKDLVTSASSGNSGANSLYLTKFTTGNEAISAVAAGGIKVATGGTFKVKMVVYNDSSGSPTTLVATANEVVNPSTGWCSFTFGTPFNLGATTPYWLGYITDVGFSVVTGFGSSTSSPPGSIGPRLGYANTYTGGAPSTLVGLTPVFGSSDSTNLTLQYLTGTYGEKLFGTPEWTPTAGVASAGANATFVSQFTALDSLVNVITGHIRFSGAHGAAKCKMLVYADDGSNRPGALIGTSNELVGIVDGINAFSFGAGFNLTGGTKYWIGYITDTSMNIWIYAGTSTNWLASSTTYGSGPLNPLYPTGGSASTTTLVEIYLDNGTPSNRARRLVLAAT